MKKITVSAPGKLMLFGEHAVVYGKPCLVTAVNQRVYATVTPLDEDVLLFDAPDVKISGYKKSLKELGTGEIPKGARFVEVAVKHFAQAYGLQTGIKISTTSDFAPTVGFGSSSAVTVCVIKSLSEVTGKKLSQKAIFDLAYKTVRTVQGKGSGVDVAAAVYGGTLYYVVGGKIIQPLKLKDLPLIVGYSGIKADTVTLMNSVERLSLKYPKITDGMYNEVGNVVEAGKKALKKQDFQTVGELMNIAQGYLASLGVSTKKLAMMVYAAREAGAYGAKLSGAGGGDCMIALSADGKRKAVEKAIINAGGEVVQIKTNAEGVKIEL